MAVIVMDRGLSVKAEKGFLFCLGFRFFINADQRRKRKTADRLHAFARALGDDEIIRRNHVAVGRQMVSVQKLKAACMDKHRGQLIEYAVSDGQDRRADQRNTSNHK